MRRVFCTLVSAWLALGVCVALAVPTARGLTVERAGSTKREAAAKLSPPAPQEKGRERARPARWERIQPVVRAALHRSAPGSLSPLDVPDLVAPFSECPPVGADSGCALLIDVTPSNIYLYSDPNQPPFDHVEDTLVGVANESYQTLGGLALTSSTNLFGFDGDGLCMYVACNYPHPTGYEGPNTSFSDISSDESSGVVNFPAGLGPNGQTTYFSLEEALSESNVTLGTGEGPVTAFEQGQTPNMRENETACNTASPVNCATGNFWHTFVDLTVPGRGPALSLARTYSAAASAVDGPFGFGWTDSYAMSLSVDGSGNVTVHQEDGSTITFKPSGSGFVAPSRVQASLVKHPDGSYSLTDFHGGMVHNFSAAGLLQNETDRNGYTTTLSYSGSQLASVTDPAGRSLTFTYNAAGRVSQVADSAGRTVVYGYAADGNLTDATDAASGHCQFGYDEAHLMTSMTDPNGGVMSNVYDSQHRVTQQIDPKNRTTTFAYVGDPSTTAGSTTTITDPRGLVTVEAYQEFALQLITTGSGTPQAATTSYSYDPFVLGIASRTDPNGHTTTYTYDRAGNLLSQTDALGRSISATWTTQNLPDSVTDPGGTTTTYGYESHGNLTQVSRPLTGSGSTQTTTFDYGDTTHPGDITSITDPDGNASDLIYNADGDLTSVTDAAGDKMSYGYDEIGRRTTMVTPRGNVAGGTPADYTWTYAYDALGRLRTATDPLGHVRVNDTYDGDGNLTDRTDADGNTTHNHFDADNELTSVTRADGISIGYSYNADGNQITYTDGAGHTTSYAFDDPAAPSLATSVTDPDNRTTTFNYDRASNLVRKQDAAGDCSASPATGCTSYSYDVADQVTGINYSDGSTPDVTFSYTADGQRATMNDGSGITNYIYDSLRRLTSTTTGVGNTVGYGYDLNGNTTSITYPNGHTVSRTYDAANRLTGVADWLGNTTTITPDRDGNTSSIAYGNGVTAAQTFNRADHLTGISDAKGGSTVASFAYTRDPNGQLTSITPTGVTQPNESYSYTQLNQLSSVNTSNYGYDAADNLTRLPNGVAQNFDAADQLTGTNQIALVGTTHQGQTTNFLSNPPLTLTLPAGKAAGDQVILSIARPTGGTVAVPGYTLIGSYTSANLGSNVNMQVYRHTVAAGDTTVTITFSNAGARTADLAVYRGVDPANPIDANSSAVSNSSTGTLLTAPSITTTRDADRLVVLDGESSTPTTWTPPGGMTTESATQQGNVSSLLADATQTVAGPSGAKTSTMSAVAHSATALIALKSAAVITYQYDSRGNRTTRTPGTGAATSYTYDQANRMISTTTGSAGSSYTYNGDGLRASHTEGGTTTQQTWDVVSRNPLLIADGVTSYVYDDNGNPVEQISGGGAALYYLHDAYGSTRLLTDNSGAVVATYTYDAYGNLANRTGTADTPLRWNGQYQDSAGLYYLRARYYDPSTGQFTTRDPLTALTGNPYSYAAGNPLNYADAAGLDTEGYCATFSLQLSVAAGTAQGCIVKTNDGRDVGFTVSAGGGFGLQLSLADAQSLEQFLSSQIKSIVTGASSSGQFTYQTSNAECIDALREWFGYNSGGFSVGVPIIGPQISGTKTSFYNTNHAINGTDLSVGVGFGGSPFGLSASQGQTYTLVFHASGTEARIISDAINALNVLTWVPREVASWFL
jgi:RHS repeat-associated protein